MTNAQLCTSAWVTCASHPILSLSRSADATLRHSGLLEQAGGVAQFDRPAFEFASPGPLANRVSDTRTCQV